MGKSQPRGTVEQSLWKHAIGLPLTQSSDTDLLNTLRTFGLQLGKSELILDWLHELDEALLGASIGQVVFLIDELICSTIVCIAQPLLISNSIDVLEITKELFVDQQLDISARMERIIDLDSGSKVRVLEYHALRAPDNFEVVHHIDGAILSGDMTSALACSVSSTDVTLGDDLLDFALGWMSTLQWSVVSLES